MFNEDQSWVDGGSPDYGAVSLEVIDVEQIDSLYRIRLLPVLEADAETSGSIVDVVLYEGSYFGVRWNFFTYDPKTDSLPSDVSCGVSSECVGMTDRVVGWKRYGMRVRGRVGSVTEILISRETEYVWIIPGASQLYYGSLYRIDFSNR